MELRLSEQDRRQLDQHGLSEDIIRQQLRRFAVGVPFTRLVRPCTPGDGIRVLGFDERLRAERAHALAAADGMFVKFVPASGAATRMFKALLALRQEETAIDGNQLTARARRGDDTAVFGLTTFTNLERFAFYTALEQILAKRGLDAGSLLAQGRYSLLLEALLGEDGLNLASLPKGLVPFHRDGDRSRTPVAEHLYEAIHTVADREHVARVHFTIAPEQRGRFEEEAISAARTCPETEIRIEFSVQSPPTDTLAADHENQPFRDDDGRLVFRPGGHGALLKNLGELDAEIVYIKNIDNVVPPHRAETTLVEKRILGGLMAELLEFRDSALRDLEAGPPNSARVAEIVQWAETELELPLPDRDSRDEDARSEFLRTALDRPLRICGMVKNEGDPGGGPFWVQRRNGRIDRQIVETSQINTSDDEQAGILASATHFNPVDLVCALRDHHGRRYDLNRYVDSETAFIATKSHQGRELKALELPGLWNGAMADWLTVFVEVPAETFNPVKTVNDLLNESHQ